MTIRKSEPKDLDLLMEIIHQAQKTMATLGIDQWQNGYPSDTVISKDITENRSYAVVLEDEICGTFVLQDERETSYDKLYDGHWLTGDDATDYLTVHRVAIALSHRGMGVAEAIIKFSENEARRKNCRSLRMDTHQGNLPMRRMLEKNGFCHCGTVRLINGNPRVAYEKII